MRTYNDSYPGDNRYDERWVPFLLNRANLRKVVSIDKFSEMDLLTVAMLLLNPIIPSPTG